ncbi:aldehyde dehydrogenase [Bdellovibrionota bacterium]
MNSDSIQTVVQKQRDFFQTGKTKDVSFRKESLKKLYNEIDKNEQKILDALKADLGKHPFEAYASENGLVLKEIRFALKNLSSWAKPQRVQSSVLTPFAKNRIYPEPYGTTLIIGPWNYPFQLVLNPLIGAIAAGNCAIVKPSKFAPQTSAIMKEIISTVFDEGHVTTIVGAAGHEVLKHRYDYIFFTGGTEVGRLVMEAATKHLTPLTLELGGKSPVIVDKDVNIDIAAKRIVWGKFWNTGQTCIAPDYLLVHESIKPLLLKKMVKYVEEFFGADPLQSPDLGRIINESHFDRLKNLMDEGNIIVGGQTKREEKFIAPTIIDNIHLENKIMKEEIFGPLLPVIQFSDLDEAVKTVKTLPKPLSLYLFSNKEESKKKILDELHFGGGCINDTLVHFSSCKLPFGGIGFSGMGAYHGKFSFDAFTHYKSITESPAWFDKFPKYPPFKNRLGLLKKVMDLV